MGGLFKRNRERNENDEFGYEKTLSAASMKLNKNGNGASKQSLRNYKVLRVGDVAFEGHTSNSFSFGRFVMNDNEDGIMSPRFASLKPKHKLQVNYWKYYVHYEPIMKYVLVKATKAGTMMNELVYDDLFKEVINVPSITEQKKIGQFLSSLATLLSLQQKKLEQIRVLKKAMLQQLFITDKNTLVPNIRFKGFVDAWEQRKLGEVAEKFDNLRIPVATSKREKGNIPYYGANGIQDYVKGYTHNGEFVLVAEDGANDLQNYPVHYINGKVWVNNHAHVLQGKRYIADNLFLINAIKKIKFETYLVGGSRAKLNADIMMKLPIILPTFSEQQKLGRFFARVDNLIVLHQRKIHTLSNLKKFCLQKMFI